MKLTQQQRIVAVMCKEAGTKKWWKAHELINYTSDPDLFVGYEAGPRVSELCREYPEIFESKQQGKYLLRRMRFEFGSQWYKTAPNDIKIVVRKYYTAKVPQVPPQEKLEV